MHNLLTGTYLVQCLFASDVGKNGCTGHGELAALL